MTSSRFLGVSQLGNSQRPSPQVFGRWLLVALVAFATVHVTYLAPRPILAQEAEPKAAEAKPAEAKPAEGSGPQVEVVQGQSTFMWIIHTSGLIGLFLLILSIWFIAMVVKLFMDLRAEVVNPPGLIQQCDAMLEQKNVQGLYDMVKADDSFFAQTLSAGIAELPHGLEEARDAAERKADALTVTMEKNISMLAVLGTLGPMIGLLGTLKGMIASFGEISRGTTIRADKVAEGISEALLLTFEGVLLSVPAIFLFTFFRNRVSSLSVNGLLMADDFLRRINRLMRSRSGGGTPAGAARS